MKTIKQTLIDANRYDDIMKIITYIINDINRFSYPLHYPYIDDNGVTIWRVNGDTTRNQAKVLLNLIEADSNGNTSDDLSILYAYVRSMSDMLLHNYAVAISHKSEPDTDIDKIRSWEILDNMLGCWNNNYDYDWDIPNGWKKEI